MKDRFSTSKFFPKTKRINQKCYFVLKRERERERERVRKERGREDKGKIYFSGVLFQQV